MLFEQVDQRQERTSEISHFQLIQQVGQLLFAMNLRRQRRNRGQMELSSKRCKWAGLMCSSRSR